MVTDLPASSVSATGPAAAADGEAAGAGAAARAAGGQSAGGQSGRRQQRDERRDHQDPAAAGTYEIHLYHAPFVLSVARSAAARSAPA